MSAKGRNIYNIFILHAKLFFLNSMHLPKKPACVPCEPRKQVLANAVIAENAAIFFIKNSHVVSLHAKLA